MPIRFVNVGNMHFAEGSGRCTKRCRWTTATWPRFARWRRWAWSAWRRVPDEAGEAIGKLLLSRESMLTDALLIAPLAGLAGVDLFDGLTHLHRPVVMGPLVGLILGDVYTGLLVGGTLELVWMGMVPLAAQPPNVVIGGVIGTAFAILTKADPKVAIGVAVPFSIAVQGCITLLFTLFSPMMHRCDRMVKELNWRGIER